MDSYDLNGLTRNLRFQTGSHYDFEAGFEGFELGGTNGPGSGKAVFTSRNQGNHFRQEPAKIGRCKSLYPQLIAIRSDAADASDAPRLLKQVEA